MLNRRTSLPLYNMKHRPHSQEEWVHLPVCGNLVPCGLPLLYSDNAGGNKNVVWLVLEKRICSQVLVGHKLWEGSSPRKLLQDLYLKKSSKAPYPFSVQRCGNRARNSSIYYGSSLSSQNLYISSVIHLFLAVQHSSSFTWLRGWNSTELVHLKISPNIFSKKPLQEQINFSFSEEFELFLSLLLMDTGKRQLFPSHQNKETVMIQKRFERGWKWK